MIQTAWLSKKLQSGKILCEACSQVCTLSEGEYGTCGVRQVQDGELKLLVYGKVAAINIDPIEKKPMFHFIPQSKALSIGTVGCNFSCTFCQNHSISQYPKQNHHQIVGDELSPQKIVQLTLHHRCESIAYTYNEPIIFFEYTYDTAKLAHQNGIKNIYVTSGYETHKAIDLLEPYIDGMNIDLKSFSDDFYKNICGAKLKPVLECIKYTYSKNIWIEITTLLIPTHNDSEDEIRKIAQFIANVDKSIPWHISAFHPMYKMQDNHRTPSSTLYKAYNIAKEEGLEYVFIGNFDNEDFESTYCPKCKNKVINRSGHIGNNVINKLNLNGTCKSCGYSIKGVWF
jgi:pyruvate formate lyase activating enzyme